MFVDESGRRGKTYRRLGWLLASFCAAYAVTLVVTVIGGNSAAPWLPLSGPEKHKSAEVVPASPAPTDSTGAVLPPGVVPVVANSGEPDGGTEPSPGERKPGASASAAPGRSKSATATAAPPPKKHDTEGGGVKPVPATSAPVSPVGSSPAPPAETTAPPAESPTPTAASSEPPVQEQEGTR